MNFQNIVQNILAIGFNNLTYKMTHKKLLENPNIQKLKSYIRNFSKIKKEELLIILKSLSAYSMNKYMINNKQIYPDIEQLSVINAPFDLNLRILAGAGTGKTTTICCRIKHLIDNGVHPKNILMLTFNVEAKANMRQKIDQLFNFPINIEVKTMDSFCKKLMRMFPDQDDNLVSLSEYGIRAKQIIDTHGPSITSQYKYVFFDEFQDISKEQFYILNYFAKSGCWLCCIGDDSQNIYQFRGSDNRYIINLDKIIHNLQTHMIQTNYRSNQKIIDIANHCILKNTERIDKNMISFKNLDGITNLTICENAKTECEFLSSRVKFYRNKGIPYDEMAVLGRTTKRLKEIETDFEKNNIPYVSLFFDKYSREDKKLIQNDRLVLSTIHSAKGLEWKVVFIVGLQDSEFPSQMNNGIINIEEERRLFYVAITRAKTHLHFVTSMTFAPFSRFLNDILHFLQIDECNSFLKIQKNIQLHELSFCLQLKNNDKNTDTDKGNNLFANDNTKNEYYQKTYCVTEMITSIQGYQIEEMRKLNLIPFLENSKTIIFNHKLEFTQKIKDNNFESDYGIFCDLYMTRELMILNNQKIKCINCLCVLNGLFMTKDEEILWNKYNLNHYFKTDRKDEQDNHLLMKKINAYDSENVYILIERLRKKVINDINPDLIKPLTVDQYISLCITNFYYPAEFFEELKQAYCEYTDITLRSKSIMKSIYLVSLCVKLSVKRRRLVYRDIYDLFEENNISVIPRIDQWINLIKKNKQICKIMSAVEHLFVKNNKSFQLINEKNIKNKSNFLDTDTDTDTDTDKEKHIITIFSGELDYLDLTESTLVDIKCSSSDMKLEWLIQILTYYSLLVKTKQPYKIENLAIINIFTGVYYSYVIPNNYQVNDLMFFIGKYIENNLNGSRVEFEIPNNLNQMVNFVTQGKDDHIKIPKDTPEETLKEIPKVNPRVTSKHIQVEEILNHSSHHNLMNEIIVTQNLFKDKKKVHSIISPNVESNLNKILSLNMFSECKINDIKK